MPTSLSQVDCPPLWFRRAQARVKPDGTEYAAMRHILYCEAVGSLMYASLATRPDISYAVATVSRFLNNPGMPHWDAVRRIYRYLLGTKDLQLTYGGMPSALVGYADADGSMAEDCRAISGYALLIDGSAVSWSSKKQEIVSLSTTESEYVAAVEVARAPSAIRRRSAHKYAVPSNHV